MNGNGLFIGDKLTVEAGPNGDPALMNIETVGGPWHVGGVDSEIEINEGGTIAVESDDLSEFLISTNRLDINPGGTLIGHGLVRGTNLENDGTIVAAQPVSNDALNLTLTSSVDITPLDIDGTLEEGSLFAVLGNIRVIDALTDPFDGSMTIGPNRHITLIEPWQFGESGSLGRREIQLEGGGSESAAAMIDGGRITAHLGQVAVTGYAAIEADVSFEAGITIKTEDDSFLLLNGETEFNGGTYVGNGTLRFNGPTTISGSSTIETAYVDLDGAGPSSVMSELTINAPLTLKVNRIDSPNVPNQFDRVMHVNGGFSRLDVQLNNPSSSWTMDGELNLNGSAIQIPFQSMLVGNPIDVTGTLRADGIATVSANLDLSGQLETVDLTSELRLIGGQHIVRDTAALFGPGKLVVSGPASLNLEDGSTVGLDVEIRARLEPGTSIGQATVVGDVEFSPFATFAVELAGHESGVDYDRLDVIGTADLGGTLEVELINDFVPQAGQVFTILTASAVHGAFNDVETVTQDVFEMEVEVGYASTRAFVRILDLFIPGDFNGDGVVDGEDFLVWQLGFGTTSGATAETGDADGDGDVDGEDFLTWQANLGEMLPPPSRGGGGASGVPEPTTFALVGVLSMILMGRKPID